MMKLNKANFSEQAIKFYERGVIKHQQAIQKTAKVLSNILPEPSKFETASQVENLNGREWRVSTNQIRTPRFIIDHQSVRQSGFIEAKVEGLNHYQMKSLADDLKKWVDEFPEEMTFWEEMNEAIVDKVLEKYPSITSLQQRISVDSAAVVPVTRTAILDYDAQSQSKQHSFHYVMPRIPVPGFEETKDIEVSMKYKETSEFKDWANFLEQHDFISTHIVEDASSQKLNSQNLQDYLQDLSRKLEEQYPYLENAEVKLNSPLYVSKPGERASVEEFNNTYSLLNLQVSEHMS